MLTPTPALAPDPRIPTGPLPPFPDVYEAFFGGGRGASFVDAIDHMGREARTSVRQLIEGAATLTRDLGATFGREAERAVMLGSPARMRELAAGAGDMAEQVFGPESDRVAEQIAGRRPDPLARAFEDVVASQGFALVGASISVYVHEMRRQWVPRRPPVERPTSPHILARHGRLGAVRVPRVTVRASAHPGDGALAATVNERLRGAAVGGRTASGRREFAAHGGAERWGSRAVDDEEAIVDAARPAADPGPLHPRRGREHRARDGALVGRRARHGRRRRGGAARRRRRWSTARSRSTSSTSTTSRRARGIGDVLAGVIGGAGRFLGGFFGGVVGGTVSGVAFPYLFAQMARIVDAIERIIDKIGGPEIARAGRERTEPAKPAESGPSLFSQLGGLAETLRLVAQVFREAAGGPAPGSPPVPEKVMGPVHSMLDLVRAVGRALDGRDPARADAARCARVVPHPARRHQARGRRHAAVRAAQRAAAPRGGPRDRARHAVVGRPARRRASSGSWPAAVDTVLESVFRVIRAGLETVLAALRIASTGLKTTIDS